ncbi:MAG: hydrogenase 4 subunit B [Deltaproteobacteria bacterium]|nr:hydrogenase 4 subunit B [Deltaproteobacteria bacterium]
MLNLDPLGLVSLSILVFLALAGLAPVLASRQKTLLAVTFLGSTFASLIALSGGFLSVYQSSASAMIMPVGLPDLPFYLRLDPLSGFFATVVALLGFLVSVYSIGYVRSFMGVRSITPLAVFYNLFLAGMLLVLVADDAYSFMVSWELMAAASFFLVAFEDENAFARKAAFIYILIAHIGAIMILLSFGVMSGAASGFESFSSYTFSSMRANAASGHIAPAWAAVAFLLALFGFGAKAGIIPLHVWLPEAHPAAPSNVSALMSGVMLKTAVYGIIRVSFDLLGVTEWWWGGLVLIIGLVSALIGILFALLQVDLKRLLAYSSVENIGVILISLGLSMIFASFKMGALSALAMIAALYHILNHAVFKGLLFMGAGSILHGARERNMERMGGLIHKMPWTAPLFLVGCLSISSLPPFSGFASEWLAFQSFLLSPSLPSPLLNLLIPLGAAVLALTAALAARCFVKVFGVAFLGAWRGSANAHVHEAGFSMKAGMAGAAVLSLALGIFPAFVIGWMDSVPSMLVSGTVQAESPFGWLWITPVAPERASYSAPIVFLGILSFVALAYLLLHARKTAIRRGPIWDCGFEKLTNRMQYNSTSFAMPLRRIFGFLFSIKETSRAQGNPNASPMFQERYVYTLKLRDRFWYMIYKPASDLSFWASRKVGRLQHGRIQIYLLYSFITLIVLLMFS